MTALNSDMLRTYELGDKHVRPMAAGAVIYQGAAVGITTAGYARPLQAGDAFGGFAERGASNVGGADGAAVVETKAKGRIVLPIAGFATGDVLKLVYASDDNTFTLTATNNSTVGRAVRLEASGLAVVQFDVASPY